MALVRRDISVPFVKGKKRVRFFRGRAVVPRDVKSLMADISDAWVNAGHPCAMRHVPVCVVIRCRRVMPKSHVRMDHRREADVYKPDVDNIEKLVLDSLNKNAWFDDGQVAMVLTVKEFRDADLGHDETVVSVIWEEDDGVQEPYGGGHRVQDRDNPEVWEGAVALALQDR